MLVSKQLDAFLIGAGLLLAAVSLVGGAGFVAGRKLNQLADNATRPVSEVFSELSARMNGWSPVELKPLMIQDFYLDENYRLTADAERTLWQWSPWRPLLTELFGSKGGAMKPQYLPLINQSITREKLHVR
ncbi:hypothetical protein [Vibrio sp. SCSIO 43137]|uniref:hypothetical protein n=1 Tax=Vibrio sp. SCSIO 43137 TaxID=3021011 RepID=UPI002307C020|nr:hypothetical protein [Vibrio sp. SCSIO 43137]WCE31115.1 hypothetical protein PK654_07575 [Vibrio sp. SCSIO 43137]